jgi:hypothetical protein
MRTSKKWLKQNGLVKRVGFKKLSCGSDEWTELMLDSVRNGVDLDPVTNELLLSTGTFATLVYWIEASDGSFSEVRIRLNGRGQPISLHNNCANWHSLQFEWDSRNEWYPIACGGRGN